MRPIAWPVWMRVQTITSSNRFHPENLLARIRAVLRRRVPEASGGVVKMGDLQLDADTHRVNLADKPLKVGPTEFKLLHYLMRHPERVHSRGALLDKVWGDHVYIEERTVDVHVKRLRESGGSGYHDRNRARRGLQVHTYACCLIWALNVFFGAWLVDAGGLDRGARLVFRWHCGFFVCRCCDLVFAGLVLLWRTHRLDDWLSAPQLQLNPPWQGVWLEISSRVQRLLRLQEMQVALHEKRLKDFLLAIQASPNGVILLDEEARALNGATIPPRPIWA
jgi:hypothetical protein